VYNTAGYTGIILDCTNTTTLPVFCVPTSINQASSCQLFYNGVLIV
jgi:hypothetical protein